MGISYKKKNNSMSKNKSSDYVIEHFYYSVNKEKSFFEYYSPVENNTNAFSKNEKSKRSLNYQTVDARIAFNYLTINGFFHIWSVFADEDCKVIHIFPGYLISANRYFISAEKWLDPMEGFEIEADAFELQDSGDRIDLCNDFISRITSYI